MHNAVTLCSVYHVPNLTFLLTLSLIESANTEQYMYVSYKRKQKEGSINPQLFTNLENVLSTNSNAFQTS